MARGPSGRVVIIVEPELKQELYVELVRRELTLKDWFISQATNFLNTSHQPLLPKEEDLSNQGIKVAHGIPSSANREKK